MQNGQTWVVVAYFVGFFLIFYLFIIMPRKNQEKKHKKLISEITRGDKVVSIGGIKGTVARVKDDSFIVKVNEDTEIEMLKTAIAYKAEDQ
jgi:preprotein translocase subunit YajC